MKNNKLFRFCADTNTMAGIISGSLMIVLSILMNCFPDNEVAQILLRDVLMIFLLGFIFPLYFTLIRQKEDLSVLGIHKNKLMRSLLINIIFAAALLAIFLKEKSQPVAFNLQSFYVISYILAAGIFEMIFIYGFLRYQFERSFGMIPAIILTAVFYSFHHAGFQPEFPKLFWVGIMYVVVFYITHNIFIIFPFFWGVGAVWDVLINSETGREIENVESFVIAVVLFICMVIAALAIRKKSNFY